MPEYKNIQKMRKTIAMILDKQGVKINDICSTIFALETPEWDNDYVLSGVKGIGRICQINDPSLKEIAFTIIKNKFTLKHMNLIDNNVNTISKCPLCKGTGEIAEYTPRKVTTRYGLFFTRVQTVHDKKMVECTVCWGEKQVAIVDNSNSNTQVTIRDI